ncbi:ATP-binding protein [Methanolapillus millepedarum]|uniref:Dimerisation and histidine phosphotransfer (DHp) domain-containing protein n=1 Tax=Methanolapillus millepedarum TaxID=3028296 RepID=A0AA96ZUR1_9EURY|nr:hypothetical protein MsAc7_15870 [Methanosarcinaceae archaeon Ac7]
MPQFRAKARAVDLLGKGQISDLPTAISELWKNGYDAYGDNLEAYLYLKGYKDVKKPFFVISDDGKGMSQQDILEKWIVLGTDSKSRDVVDIKGEETLWKPPRIKMGEKGIGRLSVAYLGSPMLMLTKKKGQPLQALFIDWRILENFNLYIEDVNFPLKVVSTKDDFVSVFSQLKDEFLDNFGDDDSWNDQIQLKKSIISEINEIELPSFFSSQFVDPFIKSSTETHGTKFIIFNPDDQLTGLSYSGKEELHPEYAASTLEIQKSLSGLFNVFKEDNENNNVSTKFILLSEYEVDLIANKDFFMSLDFVKCDHLIDGSFDENGQFKGKIRIYNENISYEFRANRKPGKTPYGCFNLKVGVVPGNPTESKLPGAELDYFNKKLENFGGLYIYRDGFRVLPYGRSEHDFLRFEDRRSKNAGTAFFSHRRMFGYIEISRNGNRKLTDKAGREGFINNIAYREFKTDLEAFFKDLAYQYFGTHAKSNIKSEQKDKLTEAAKNERLEKEKEKKLRAEYVMNLKEYPQQLATLAKEYGHLIEMFAEKQNQSKLTFESMRDLLKDIEVCKSKVKKLELKEPVRFSLTETQQKNLFNYNKEYSKVWECNIEESQPVIENIKSRLNDYELSKEFDERCNRHRTTLSQIFDEAADEIKNSVFQKIENMIKEEKNIFLTEFDKFTSNLVTRNINSNLNKNEIVKNSSILDNFYDDLQSRADDKIKPFISHINGLSFEINEDELTGFYKIRYEEILKQWDQTKELAQLGIAVEIIDHQFNALYSDVSNSIKNIKVFIPNDPKALDIYSALKNSFEHLETRYRLMSPLYRTTGRVRKNIRGDDIKRYLDLFFKNMLAEQQISFDSSSNFNNASFLTYESILLPAFINVIYNAVYWLKSSEHKKIYLDYDGASKILIINSGVPIEDFYLEKIFELFYSQKPNGRGIGLFLAKETLQSIGYDMYATNDPEFNSLKGACFIINTNFEKL